MHMIHLALAFVTVSSYGAPAIAIAFGPDQASPPGPRYSFRVGEYPTHDECVSKCPGGYCTAHLLFTYYTCNRFYPTPDPTPSPTPMPTRSPTPNDTPHSDPALIDANNGVPLLKARGSPIEYLNESDCVGNCTVSGESCLHQPPEDLWVCGPTPDQTDNTGPLIPGSDSSSGSVSNI